MLIYDNSAEMPEAVFHIEGKQIIQIANNVIDWCKKLPNELLNLGFSIT